MPSWVALDEAIELLYDFFRDVKAQPYALGVDLLGFVDEPKHHEQLLEVLLLYADALVCHWDYQEVARVFKEALILYLNKLFGVSEFVLAVDYLAIDYNFGTSWRKLDGVWHQVMQNLLEPLSIGVDDVIDCSPGI